FNSGVGVIPTSFVTAGALGLFSWILLFLALAWEAIKALLRRKEGTHYGLARALLAGALYLFVFEVMYIPGIAPTALLFFLLGILAILRARENGRVLSSALEWNSLAGILRYLLVLLL